MAANIALEKHSRQESRADFTFVKPVAYVSFSDTVERKKKQT